ncbi:MAG: GNAT family N-acetyltransferase [Nitrococcus sp.]|nr:GNAT family N-acetyltransferase [Nitrococcus sp.]
MGDICCFDSFSSDMPERWRQFIDQNALTFDQTLPWFIEFERHLLGPSQHLHILAVEEAAAGPLALLPLSTDRIALAGPISVTGLTALSNYYTAFFAPLAVANRDRGIAQALVQGISELDADNAVIDINPLASDSRMVAEMASEWMQRNYEIERYFRFGNWHLKLAGRTSQEYLASLPGHVRSTLVRKGKKMHARSDASIRIVTAVADVPAAMDAYEAVYLSSWKIDEPHKEFIRSIATEFARRNWLRLGLVEIGSRPIAAQIWFVYRGTASIFKLAYDAEFRNISAGSLLTMTLMQHVIDVDKVTTVDYLCGDDPYKRDWMSARHERIGIRAVRRFSWPGVLNRVTGVARRILPDSVSRASD